MPHVGARSILVIDDDSVARGLLVRILEEEGYLVRGAGTTMECLALLDGGAEFDLLGVDVVMPPSMPPEGGLETVEILTKPEFLKVVRRLSPRPR
jgi:CheY-like chemotaxis protein